MYHESGVLMYHESGDSLYRASGVTLYHEFGVSMSVQAFYFTVYWPSGDLIDFFVY
jgi:hypothetical protein